MKNVPMRFCGYTLHHNPSNLKVESFSSVHELYSPCCKPESIHLGNRLRRIRGEGELYGADCIAQFRRLHTLYEQQEKGLLSLPHMPSMTAYLRELDMIAEPKENVLGYRFEFVEAHPHAEGAYDAQVHVTLVEGESLWDISHHYGVPIDELVRLNPQVRYIDMLDEGERVRLC